MRTITVVVAIVTLLALAMPGEALGRKLAIGDSVMRGAANELRARGFRVNTTVSRQFSDAPGLVRQLRRAGRLPRTVVIHLGNNGIVEPPDCRRAVRAAGNRRVFLVTVKVPRAYRAPNNRKLRACARRHGARIIDWYGFSRSHGGWFYRDGFHLTPIGQRNYARLIARAT